MYQLTDITTHSQILVLHINTPDNAQILNTHSQISVNSGSLFYPFTNLQKWIEIVTQLSTPYDTLSTPYDTLSAPYDTLSAYSPRYPRL